jgi:folate-binding Fe-S cluster repair protein YgfZ
MGLAAYDVSEWGFFRFMGEDVRDFLQGLVTADLKLLKAGECLPACVLNPKGLLMADCELYEETPGAVLAVTRPAAAINFLKVFDKRIMLSKSKLAPLRAQNAWLVVGRQYTAGLPWAAPARDFPAGARRRPARGRGALRLGGVREGAHRVRLPLVRSRHGRRDPASGGAPRGRHLP